MIVGSDELWDPNEWEAFVYGLLQDRHGPLNVQRMPARHRGDHGIDYYCLADGAVYQCYCVEEPCDVATRASNQIRKATDDLKKLCSDSTTLKELFAIHPVRRWVLVVPLHDSSTVNQHLANKTVEVLVTNLPYIDPAFEAHVQDLKAFAASSIQERQRQAAQITIPTRVPTAFEITDWTESQNELVQNLIRKLKKRIPVDSADDADRVIGWFLERENLLDDLRSNASQLSETIRQVLNRHTTRLEFAGPPSNAPQQVLRDALNELTEALCEEITNLSRESAEKIALGTVADWLLRCPLDFPPFEHAS